MARPNKRLIARISNEALNHFVKTGRGITYEALATILELPMDTIKVQLDFLEEDSHANESGEIT